MDEDRLITVETRLAHLEHTLAQLDDTVIAQAAEIDRLRQLSHELTLRLRELAQKKDAGGVVDDERPPHY